MDWGSLVMLIAPALVTFLLGLVANKPGYKKGKNVVKVLSAALEDDKLTATEIEQILAAIQAEKK